ncbi:hypothetical protein M9H77_23307 [Catharanthus roseus]|uniref:Uncharacterized protein n=1 Tax=Catharanthus roseus TaxID=4058 RepID=A0ACC0ASX9_CATRO|nr:hypothetical protein M9H77_23307 [Catharanthus roseus]
MVDSCCSGIFLHKTTNEAWDLFENLSDNSQQLVTSSRIGTSRQIGNRGGMQLAKTQILDSHTQSLAKLENQIRQLARAISKRDEDKLPSHPIENPRANYHEQDKAIITLRNEKLVDNKVGEPIEDSELNENKTEGIDMGTKI